MKRSLLGVAAAALLAVPALSSAATLRVINGDGPGEGFNDPVYGPARQAAFLHAAKIWGDELASPVEITIYALFDPLACTATSAVLGSAGTYTVWRDFPGAPLAGTWYPAALANKYAGVDLDPSTPDIIARFNSNIGTPGCLEASRWDYSVNASVTPGEVNLVTVLLHEFGHGLGFASYWGYRTTGLPLAGYPDVYSTFLYDRTQQKFWTEMTASEVLASSVNGRGVVWTGPEVTQVSHRALSTGVPYLDLVSPVAKRFDVGTASFGAPIARRAPTSEIALADDGVGAVNDGCQPFTNASAIAGRIALVDRGTCTFVVKAANAQAAGAIGLLVADNTADSPPAGLGGTDPSISIWAVRITRAAGTELKGYLAAGPVTGRVALDTSTLAGADENGMVFLNTPRPLVPGSSVSHWDPLTFPNQLMEPAINDDLTHKVDVPYDLTSALLRDIGW